MYLDYNIEGFRSKRKYILVYQFGEKGSEVLKFLSYFFKIENNNLVLGN